MNKRIPLQLICGAALFLAACGQGGLKSAPEEAMVEAQGASLNLSVNSTSDSPDTNPGNGTCLSVAGGCTLRAAVQETNAYAGKDKINVPAGLYVLTAGHLPITDSLVILGSREGTTTVDGNNYDMVFYIDDGNYTDPQRLTAEFHHLTIRNGYGQVGGGIRNDGARVLVHKSTVMENDAFSAGGGIHNSLNGYMEIRYSTIRNNGHLDDLRGGGIENDEGSFMLIYKSAVHHNQANRFGAMRNLGTLNIVNSTVSHNQSRIEDGGILNTGEAALNNVTIAYNEGTIEYENSQNGSAAGLTNIGTLLIANSIVAHNINHHGVAQDCTGDITSMGYNLFGDTTDCDIVGDLTGNLIGVDPLLSALGNNGGSTFTHRLEGNSPARNAGNPAKPTGLGTTCEPDDQRNINRKVGPARRCDMGAYEVQGAPGGVVSP